MRRVEKQRFAAFLLALFVAYTISITFFVHSHIVDGQLITHSHPYRGTPDSPGHGHSSAQFQLIEQLSNFLTTGTFTAFFIHFFAGKKIVRNFVLRQFWKNPHFLAYNLRAPPFSVIS